MSRAGAHTVPKRFGASGTMPRPGDETVARIAGCPRMGPRISRPLSSNRRRQRSPPLIQDAVRSFFASRPYLDLDRDLLDRIIGSIAAQRGRDPGGHGLVRVTMASAGPHADPGRLCGHNDDRVGSGARSARRARPKPPASLRCFGPRSARSIRSGTRTASSSGSTTRNSDCRPTCTTALARWTPEAAEPYGRTVDPSVVQRVAVAAFRRRRLNAEGERLLERVRAELPDRYELVDDWRRL